MFRVEWIQDALNDLTRIWTPADSSLRREITRASHELETALRSSPYSFSESREGDERVVFAAPLAASIEIDPDNKTVWVLNVWLFRRRAR